MIVRTSFLLMTILVLVTWPLAAIAGPCDAYFTFDDTLADAGPNGYDGEMIGPKGSVARATYTEGKFGQALQLDGTGAMRALIDLHWDSCPQVTFSAWIKVSRDVSSPSQVLFSSGQGSGPGMYFSTSYLTLKGTDNGIHQQNAVRPGGWMFVAGVYNYETDVYELYYGGRSPKPGKLALHRSESENAFWIGTENDAWGVFASGVAVDELRITGSAFSKAEVAAIRARKPDRAVAGAEANNATGPTRLPGDQYEPAQLPGDQYEPTRLPGDQYEPARLPGDQYEPARLPGDQYEPSQIPGTGNSATMPMDDPRADAAASTEIVIDVPKPDVGARTKDLIDVPEPDVGN